MKIQRTIQTITAEAALRIVELALAAAKGAGIAVSVSVSDALMNEIAFGKADGATPHSAFTSRKKAQTAASTKKATGWMPPDLALTLPLASDNNLTNVAGGLPIESDGVVIGAIGVAGGTVDPDVAIATSALKQLGTAPADA